MSAWWTPATKSVSTHNDLSFPPCQRRFFVRPVPTTSTKEKATVLKGLFVSVFVSLFAFIFIFYDCPLLPLKHPQRDRHGEWEIVEGGVWEKRRGVGGSFEGEREELKMASVVKEAR